MKVTVEKKWEIHLDLPPKDNDAYLGLVDKNQKIIEHLLESKGIIMDYVRYRDESPEETSYHRLTAQGIVKGTETELPSEDDVKVEMIEYFRTMMGVLNYKFKFNPEPRRKPTNISVN